MAWISDQAAVKTVWDLGARQHGVVAYGQLRELGFSDRAIEHRATRGRLHRVRKGVYAVGRPQLTRRGHWMAAVLGCGSSALLSHGSAAALWGIGQETDEIEVTVSASSRCRQSGVIAHRRSLASADLAMRDEIPLTCPVRTLLDLATRLDPRRLERAVNEVDRLDLGDPEALRVELENRRGQRGVARLRAVLDREAFRLTRSELERRFLPLAAGAGMPVPQTRRWVNGFEVDFYWPDLGLVIETDGLRYHRTPAQQARDRLRDQAHTAAGLTHLRFTHAQVRFEARYVRGTLYAVAQRLADARGPK